MVPTSVTPSIFILSSATSSISTALTKLTATTFATVAEYAIFHLVQVCSSFSKKSIVLWILYIYPIWALFSLTQDLYSKHPIAQLMDEARIKHEAKVARQSKTLPQAIAEYTRRYHRSPPPGFDLWFARAKELNVTMIDEYDTITKAFEPLWKFPVHVLRSNLKNAIDGDQVLTAMFEHGILNSTTSPPFQLLGEFQKQAALFKDAIPNLDVPLAMNRFADHDLPRVVWPRDTNITFDAFEWENLNFNMTWDALTASCPAGSPVQSRTSLESKPFGFLEDVAGSKEVCHHPELRHIHGAWSPSNNHIITHNAVPIWSATKLSTHGDLLFPSAYYADDFRRASRESTSWHNKTNDLYWAGSTTGVFLRGAEHWTQYPSHRHHLVAYVNGVEPWDTNNTQFLRKEHPNDAYSPFSLPATSMASRYDVSFSHVVQCEGVSCEKQVDELHPKTEQLHWAHESHRLLLDIDGNSFSGRFYRLLEANATVLKATIFQEPHDDILMPWFHYVPISIGLEELGETVRYFTEEGQDRAWDIAREGRNFALHSLRREDNAAGWVRALLEYNRVMSEDRDEMSCY